MASCQQYESQICGDSDQQKPQTQPHMQEQIVRVSCKAYPHKDLDIEKAIPNQDLYVLTLLPHSLGKTNQIWEKIEIRPLNNDNDQQKSCPIRSLFLLVNPVAKQILCAEGDEVVPVPNTVKGGSYPASVLWTEAASYIKTIDGRMVWTAEGEQDIKIKLRAMKFGQANQQWNIKHI